MNNKCLLIVGFYYIIVLDNVNEVYVILFVEELWKILMINMFFFRILVVRDFY